MDNVQEVEVDSRQAGEVDGGQEPPLSRAPERLVVIMIIIIIILVICWNFPAFVPKGSLGKALAICVSCLFVLQPESFLLMPS